jgi:hypothetical protein
MVAPMETILVKIFATALALSQVTTTPDAVNTRFDRAQDQQQVSRCGRRRYCVRRINTQILEEPMPREANAHRFFSAPSPRLRAWPLPPTCPYLSHARSQRPVGFHARARLLACARQSDSMRPKERIRSCDRLHRLFTTFTRLSPEISLWSRKSRVVAVVRNHGGHHFPALLSGQNEATGTRARELHQPRRDMLAPPSLGIDQGAHRLRDGGGLNRGPKRALGDTRAACLPMGNGERTTDRPQKPRERMRTNVHQRDEKRRFYLSFPVRPGRS